MIAITGCPPVSLCVVRSCPAHHVSSDGARRQASV